MSVVIMVVIRHSSLMYLSLIVLQDVDSLSLELHICASVVADGV